MEMDLLLTLPSPRSLATKTSFSHKCSARDRKQAPSPRSVIPHAPPPRGTVPFRSIRVLEDIARIEISPTTELKPENALQLLRRFSTEFSTDFNEINVSNLLGGLEDACWRRLTTTDCDNQHHLEPHQIKKSTAPHLSILYSQLYHGIMDSIREKETTIQHLEVKIRETMLQTNALPAIIKEREESINQTISSFLTLSAASLDCAVPMGRAEPGTNVIKLPVEDIIVATKVKDRIATLHRRKDLRIWSCNELRTQIDDHVTRVSELKKEITVGLSDIKREEVANKMKTKRLEDAMAATAASTSRRRMSTMSNPRVLTGRSQPMRSGNESQNIGNERLMYASEQRVALLYAIEQQKQKIRSKTEAIFEVRNQIRDLAQKKANLLAESDAFKLEMANIDRSCTPRPEWDKIKRAITKSSVMEEVNNITRSKRGTAGDDMNELEDDPENRLAMILSSNWSTIDRVNAMSSELDRIRQKYHFADEVSNEQTKLDQLQREIQKTLQHLAKVRSMSTSTGS